MWQQVEHQVVSHSEAFDKHIRAEIFKHDAHYMDDSWVLRQHSVGGFLHEGKTTAAAIKEECIKKLFIK
jgi:hypothetical protein